MRAGTALALAALLLAGCGGSTGPTANPNARSAAPPSAAAPPPSFAAPSPAPASPSASASARRDERIVVTGYTGFGSPSGNISCGAAPEDDHVRCDIAEREWEPPPPPEGCELDYGSGLEVDSDGARLVCAGDAVGATEIVLEYGERLQAGQVLCESSEDGMRCEHLDTGDGFLLARARYELLPAPAG